MFNIQLTNKNRFRGGQHGYPSQKKNYCKPQQAVRILTMEDFKNVLMNEERKE